MTADVSSVAFIKSDSKALQNVSTCCYHFKTVLWPKHPTWDTNCCFLSFSLWDRCHQVGTIIRILSHNYILQSIWSSPAELTEDWMVLTCVPCALANFMPLPNSAERYTLHTDGLSVNNELQSKWFGLIWGTILRMSKTKKHLLPQDSRSLPWDCVWGLWAPATD
jgi:hypothetical protein